MAKTITLLWAGKVLTRQGVKFMSIKRTVLAAAATLALLVPAYAAQISPMNDAATGGSKPQSTLTIAGAGHDQLAAAGKSNVTAVGWGGGWHGGGWGGGWHGGGWHGGWHGGGWGGGWHGGWWGWRRSGWHGGWWGWRHRGWGGWGGGGWRW
jgi:hypothetical protein